MNPVLRKSLFFRFLLTPFLYFTKQSILKTILLLIILDIIDCNPFIIKLFPDNYKDKNYCSLDKDYEFYDKLIDIFQYSIALYFLKNILPNPIFYMASIFIFYRLIGILVFLYTKFKGIYIYFFDFFKEYLFLYYTLNSNLSNIYIFLGISVKVWYEYLMHNEHYFLSLYKKFFEK